MRPVHLAAVDECSAVCAKRIKETFPVLHNKGRIVPNMEPHIQASEKPLADTAIPAGDSSRKGRVFKYIKGQV